MAKSYGGLRVQCDKVRGAYEKLTPPKPDDEFEDLRRAVLQHMDKMDKYLAGRVSGEGSTSTPTASE